MSDNKTTTNTTAQDTQNPAATVTPVVPVQVDFVRFDTTPSSELCKAEIQNDFETKGDTFGSSND